MVASPGVLRPHCEGFVRSIEALDQQEFASRWEGAKRSIRENGVTYNIYGDPQGVDRPWELDMVPLLISPAEWARLETALVQRTTLLNLILADLYGPQTLLGRGLLPPSLVFSNPAFLRPCHGIRVPHGIHLHVHAVDLARSPDGQWWVLADRTQAPSGAGYALENRIVLLRNLPEAFRDCQVHRLASFFRAQRDTLMALAPHLPDQPRVVLLTPRAAQRNLLRACVPRALSGLHDGRRRRPDGAGSPRLHQDARRPSAGRRHLPAGSTTVSAIRSNCAATRRSAWPAWSRRRGPATSRSPTRSAPA